jgi:peptidoglycan L-alanyl-D-glutamate endopeptidase CwlK
VNRWSDRSLRNLKGIHPDLRRVLNRALQDSPLDFVIIEGLRTRERQRELVAKGASKTMNSRHLTGHAVDICPLVDINADGRVSTEEMFSWEIMTKLHAHIAAAAAAENVPLTWGGLWASFPDGPHYELHRATYPA